MWAGQLRRSSFPLLFACVTALSAASQQSTAIVEATTVATTRPAGVAYDANGNLYVASQGDHVVRKVDLKGIITTVAGTGEQGFSGDGGAATSAQLDTPSGVAVDSTGNLFIADSHNHRIRRVGTDGIITTIAGNGVAGLTGDGANATSAELNFPTGVSVGSGGTLYIADSANQVIRKVTNGVISTVAGTGQQGYSGDGGPAVSAQLDTPTGVAVDPNVVGQIYIADRHNHRVRIVAANGTITTVAGTGQPSFSGDGGTGTAAGLDGPRGVAVTSNGLVYLADSDNQRIRVLTGSQISTVAGTGEQGFAGDVASPARAILDTPGAVAASPLSTFTFADTHNDRVRDVDSSQLNTIVGIAPPLTEGIVLSGPTSGVFGSALGQLTALVSNGSNQASGNVTLYRDGSSIATAPISSNRATFDLSGTPGGLHTFAATFAGDSINGPATSGLFLINVAAAAQTITFLSLPATVAFTPGLTEALQASSTSGLPITYTATGPATVSGSTLTITGPGTVTVTASQAGNAQYAGASASQSIVVSPASLVLTSLSPTSAPLGGQNVTITVMGSGFTATSVVQVNGAAVPTTFVSSNVLTASLPALMSLGQLSVTVYDPAVKVATAAVPLTVVAPTAQAVVQVASTNTSAQQPSVNLQLQQAYPVPLAGVFSLSFSPDDADGATDPNILFSNGKNSVLFTIPANSTAVPAVAIQTGTVAGIIRVQLALTAAGQDVTPTAARLSTIVIPRQAPFATITFTQNGSTLTVTAQGYSNTRDMTSALFTFQGDGLATHEITVPASSLFGNWYSGSTSQAAGGSIFTYTQTFQLSDGDAKVQSVGLQLTNSAGTSAKATAP